jgi:hypothetical protein
VKEEPSLDSLPLDLLCNRCVPQWCNILYSCNLTMYDCDIDWYMIIWWNQLLVSPYYNSFCGFSLRGKIEDVSRCIYIRWKLFHAVFQFKTWDVPPLMRLIAGIKITMTTML